MKKWQRIEVHWNDAVLHEGWIAENKLPLDEKQMPHNTIGYFYGETKNSILLAQSISEHTGEEGKTMDAVMQIPRGMIKKIKKL